MSDLDTHLLLRAFADELARCDVAGACTSPGSRSSPLVLALARDARISTWSHPDERVAGFFALGLAKASGRPAVLTCTSGTAAAQYLPAVIEAHEAGIPLIVLTADRPPELREVGAGQAIDQLKLYGDAARWFFEVGTHDASPERGRWIRTLACRSVAVASGRLGGRPGPVHLNWALREPLVPPAELPADPQPGRADGAPWVHVAAPVEVTGVDELQEAVSAARRGVIVAGRLPGGDGAAAAAVAERLRWPLLADPISGARRSSAAVAHYDAFLRIAPPGDAPDLVLRFGDLPTSKPLRQWLAGLDAPQIACGFPGAWADPDGRLSTVVTAAPGAVCDLLVSTVGEAGVGPPPAPAADGWLDAWRDADAAAGRAIAEVVGEELSEPAVAGALAAALPDDTTLVVASSMPVRDLETFAPVRPDAPRVLSNRGANGIDGTLATAFGAAAATGGPVAVLLGDVAFAYDLSALLCAKRHGLPLTIVVLNNGGGGIFEFLPLASIDRSTFEEHVATDPDLEIARAADLYGCDHVAPDTLAAFRRALGAAVGGDRTTIIEVRTDRAANVALHREIWAAVAAAR
jgi:2-succinyl-5-enolpyruvyl-6-hydroxy-3-cyclohexene-1-carboxylate synthase